MNMEKEEWDDFVERLHHHNRGEGVNEHRTASPIFMVQKKERVWGLEPEYVEGTAYIEDDSGEHHEYATIAECLKELDEDQIADIKHSAWLIFDERLENLDDDDMLYILTDKGHDIQLVGYIDRWENINAHLTREAAQAFIDRKSHDYPAGLRIYVESLYWCKEFKQVIDAILDGKVKFLIDVN